MSKRRVHELAKEVGLEKQELVTLINGAGLGISVNNYMTVLSSSEVEEIKAALGGKNVMKPHCVVGTIGHVDHGKTTLTAAISQVLALRGMAQKRSFGELDRTREERRRGISQHLAYIEYVGNKYRYTHIDCPGHADFTKTAMRGMAQMHAAILVVSAADGPMPQTRDHIIMARTMGVSAIVVYLNKMDMVADEELADLVELEVRELLSKYAYPGDEIPFIRGSALDALEGKSGPFGLESIRELVEALDEYVVVEKPRIDLPFMMPIAEVFGDRRRPTVVGRVDRGMVAPGGRVELVGLDKRVQSAGVRSVERFNQPVERAEANQVVSLRLSEVDGRFIRRGQTVAAIGTAESSRKFEADVDLLTQEEGGRHTPVFSGYQASFHLRTAVVTGTVFLVGEEMAMPGDRVHLRVVLLSPVPLEEGLRLAMHEGGRLIGTGVITTVLDAEKAQREEGSASSDSRHPNRGSAEEKREKSGEQPSSEEGQRTPEKVWSVRTRGASRVEFAVGDEALHWRASVEGFTAFASANGVVLPAAVRFEDSESRQRVENYLAEQNHEWDACISERASE